MQAPPHTIDVQDRQVPVPVPSQLELELRCRMMEIDRRIEIQRSDEYRRMMFAMVSGGSGHYPGQLLPVPVPEQEIRPVPGPMVVWGSSSSPSMVRGHPAALPDLPDPHGAVAQAGPATCLALSSSLVPSSSSSQCRDQGDRTCESSADAHPSPILPHAGHTDNRFGSPAAVELLLRKNGIEPFSQLKQQDAALADATPNVTSARFAVLFGGLPLHERPCSRVRNILCIDRVVQPYAPSSPGESGVIFFTPGTILFEDNYPSFHMFLNISPQTTYRTKRKFCYLGAYCKVPSTSQTVEVEEWLSLPIMCRASWSWRIHSTKVPGVRAIHARISIRNGRPHGPPPSQDEVEEWLKNHPERRDGLGDGNIVNAFNKGEERINFTLVKCIGYDVGVAIRLQ